MQRIKKNNILTILYTIIFVLCASVLALVHPNILRAFWFEGILLYISIVVLTKSILLDSSSNFWFSCTLLLLSIILICNELGVLDRSLFIYLFAFSPVISSLFTSIIYKKLLYLYACVGLTCLVTPISLYINKDIHLALFLVLIVGVICIDSLILKPIIGTIKKGR